MTIPNQNTAHVNFNWTHDLLKAFVENMPARVFWKDRESRYLGCNTQFANDAGCADSDQIIGKSDFDLCWKAQAKTYRANDREVMETASPLLNYVEQQQTPDGRLIWLETSKLPLYDERRQVVGLLGTYQDITERKENEDLLFKKMEMHRAICDSTHFSIITTDERGVIYLFNVGAERMLGYSAAEAIGQLAPEVIGQRILKGACDPQTGETTFIELSAKPADAATLLGLETLALKTRHRTDKLCILNFLRKDGSVVPSQVSVSTLHDVQWRTIGYLLIGSDASARYAIDQERERHDLSLKQINRELTNAKLAAEQANVAKSAFLASMSHEIRTPMNGVVGMIGVLQQSSLSRHQSEMVDIISNSAMALLSIINDILDFSKIEAGKLQLECLPIEVVGVVEKTHRIMLSLAEKQGVALTW